MADMTPRDRDTSPNTRKTMKVIDVVALVLLIIGGINWGLVGLFQFDLVAALFMGSDSPLSRLIYTLVGISALYEIFALPAMRRRWVGGTRSTIARDTL